MSFRAFLPFRCLFALVWLLCAGAGIAQSTPLLQLTQIEAPGAGPVEFRFTDAGSGATNYVVEFSSAVGGQAAWDPVPATLTGLGGGNYQALAVNPGGQTGYYRVRALGVTITANFASAAFRVTEGGGVAPTIEFSAPFLGWLRYSLSGTVEAEDYETLSGEVFVNGTTVTIPVTFTENTELGQLKYLTLKLEGGAGLLLGARSQTTVTMDENDALWQGSAKFGQTTLGFVVEIRRSGDVVAGVLRGDGFGFFPETEQLPELVFTETSFLLTAGGIEIPASATALETPMRLSLRLSAEGEVPGDSVGVAQVEGGAILETEVREHPTLSTTNHGRFLLFRPPVQPSTNDVPLVAVP